MTDSSADYVGPDGGSSGDASAHRVWIDTIARNYAPALRQFFERRLDSKSDAADLVQDVFMRLARMKVTETINKPEHYLFTIASNALRDHYRRNSVRQAHAHQPLADRDASLDFSAAEILEGRQAVRELEHVLRQLPERTRDVFVFRMLDERRTDDVARSLGISTRAVEKHYAKALAHITRALRAYRD